MSVCVRLGVCGACTVHYAYVYVCISCMCLGMLAHVCVCCTFLECVRALNCWNEIRNIARV